MFLSHVPEVKMAFNEHMLGVKDQQVLPYVFVNWTQFEHLKRSMGGVGKHHLPG